MIKKTATLALTFCAAALIVLPVFAHHSFQATYDMDAPVLEIEGTLLQLNFRNPHSSVMVMAPDENGEMQRWGIEWGGASLLIRQGLTRTSFIAGDHVIVTGSPARNRDDHRLRMQSIFRPIDGFGWGAGEGETFD